MNIYTLYIDLWYLMALYQPQRLSEVEYVQTGRYTASLSTQTCDRVLWQGTSVPFALKECRN